MQKYTLAYSWLSIPLAINLAFPEAGTCQFKSLSTFEGNDTADTCLVS